MDIPTRETADYFPDSKHVKELNPNDFERDSTCRLKNKNCAVILFYAPWCPHCSALKKTWEELGKKSEFIDVCAFNCEKYSRHYDMLREELPSFPRGYPTIVVYKNGNCVEEIKKSSEDRTVPNFIKACMRVCSSS